MEGIAAGADAGVVSVIRREMGLWLSARQTPLLWVRGPLRVRQEAEAVVRDMAGLQSMVLRLSGFSVDRCLARLLARAAPPRGSAVSTARLARFVGAAGIGVLVLDGLGGAAQLDLRLRFLLGAAARRQFPEMGVVVTSADGPSSWISPDTVTVVQAVGIDGETAPGQLLPESGAGGLPSIAEVLACVPGACSGWMLGVLTGEVGSNVPSGQGVTLATPSAVAECLAAALESGTVRCVVREDGADWFEAGDALRGRFLAGGRVCEVNEQVARMLCGEAARPYLEQAVSEDPGMLLDLLEQIAGHWVACGDLDSAMRCYWQDLGNFRALRKCGHVHRGARICRALNAGSPPEQVSAALASAAAAMPVLNDWGLFAWCAGDALTAVAAALSAYAAAGPKVLPAERVILAGHVCDALILHGELREAAHWARLAKRHALQEVRRTEGLPTAETMGAVDTAAAAAVEVAARVSGSAGVDAELRELVAVHERQRGVLRNFNKGTFLVPLPGPTGPVDPEELLDGRPAALAAALRGDASETRRILSARLEQYPQQRQSGPGLRAELLVAHAQLVDGNRPDAGFLQSCREGAEDRDDPAVLCEVTVLESRAALLAGTASEALPPVEQHLRLAADLRLGLHWIDLLVVRSELLLAVGRPEEARVSAAVALYGPDADGAVASVLAPLQVNARDMPGARLASCGYRVAAAAAIRALTAAGGEVDADTLAAFGDPGTVPAVRTAPMPPARPPIAAHVSGIARRLALRETARQVLRDHLDRGTPFALYLRTFGDTVMHGPMEFGPRLLENSIRDALPPGVELVTVQDRRSIYDGVSSVNRNAPALILTDEEWEEVVTALIASADVIVSECPRISSGVRTELEAVYQSGRWDRTVLVLPPLDCPYPTIDSDPLIQTFPRCVWADSLRDAPLAVSPVLKDLLERLQAIAELPEAERLKRQRGSAASVPHDIDLIPLANWYESAAQTSLMFAYPDDESYDKTSYYAFWMFFRAVSIRGQALLGGNDSPDNKSALAYDYTEMSGAMLEVKQHDDKIIVPGDLALAEQCARSAYTLAEDNELIRSTAERHYRELTQLREAIRQYPDGIILRPRYGPFLTRHITPPYKLPGTYRPVQYGSCGNEYT